MSCSRLQASALQGHGATVTSFLPSRLFLGGKDGEVSAQTAKTALDPSPPDAVYGPCRMFARLASAVKGGSSCQGRSRHNKRLRLVSTCGDMHAVCTPLTSLAENKPNIETVAQACYITSRGPGHDVIHVHLLATDSDFAMLLISCQCRGCRRPIPGAVVHSRPSAPVWPSVLVTSIILYGLQLIRSKRQLIWTAHKLYREET